MSKNQDQDQVWQLLIAIIFCAFLLTGCVGVGSMSRTLQDSGPSRSVDVSHIKNAVPRYEPITKAGNSSPYVVLGKTYNVDFNVKKGFSQKGKASWYGKKFHGNKTANGEIYNMYAMTAAHKTLPIPSYVKVTHLKNRRSVVVRVNDRGPFHGNRIIDLSYAAAKKLGIHEAGTGNVRVDVVTPQKPPLKNHSSVVKSDFLQIGAFRWHSGALELQKRISKLTSHKVIVSAPDKNKFYKVLIGPIHDRVELESLKKRLSLKKLPETHRVKF